MSLNMFYRETCPKCHKPMMQPVIEPHPTRSELAFQNFECADCGAVRTKVYTLKPGEPLPELPA